MGRAPLLSKPPLVKGKVGRADILAIADPINTQSRF